MRSGRSDQRTPIVREEKLLVFVSFTWEGTNFAVGGQIDDSYLVGMEIGRVTTIGAKRRPQTVFARRPPNFAARFRIPGDPTEFDGTLKGIGQGARGPNQQGRAIGDKVDRANLLLAGVNGVHQSARLAFKEQHLTCRFRAEGHEFSVGAQGDSPQTAFGWNGSVRGELVHLSPRYWIPNPRRVVETGRHDLPIRRNGETRDCGVMGFGQAVRQFPAGLEVEYARGVARMFAELDALAVRGNAHFRHESLVVWNDGMGAEVDFALEFGGGPIPTKEISAIPNEHCL
jgi:hypothetical protein